MGGNGTYKGVYFLKQLVAVWTSCNRFSAAFLFFRMKRQLDHCCLDFHATGPKSGCNQWLDSNNATTTRTRCPHPHLSQPASTTQRRWGYIVSPTRTHVQYTLCRFVVATQYKYITFDQYCRRWPVLQKTSCDQLQTSPCTCANARQLDCNQPTFGQDQQPWSGCNQFSPVWLLVIYTTEVDKICNGEMELSNRNR